VSPAGPAPGGSAGARLLGVSAAGARLAVGRDFPEGELICVELPAEGPPPALAVLACVERSRRGADGAWVVECRFSRGLGDGDLRAFAAGEAAPRVAAGRQAGGPLSDLPKVFYHLTPPADPTPWPAEVLDLGPAGMELRVGQDVRPGALLSVQLDDAHGQPLLTILASVVRVAADPDGGGVLGCDFIRELSAAEWRALRR
jgi:hypothetical protein